MQFQVPQFIEVEDKIIGPLTFKQFVFVGGGFGMAYVLWRVLPILLAAPLIARWADLRRRSLSFIQRQALYRGSRERFLLHAPS